MRHSMTFHPEWGCLSPAPSFMRTVRSVFVATAVGVTAGGGVVFAFVDHSAGGQTSVAERTLVRPVLAAPTSFSATETAQLSSQTSEQIRADQVLQVDGHMKDPATNELNTSSPARPTIVAASDEVDMAVRGGPTKTAVASWSTRRKRSIQTARHKTVLSSLRQAKHSLPARFEPNAVQRFLTGLTATIEHVWSQTTSTDKPASRARRNGASAATT
jgi:hypothetical protein